MNRRHTLSEMALIQSEFERRFSGVPGLLGVGIGKDQTTGDYALKVYVMDNRASGRLPKSFNDVAVSIDVTGQARVQ